MSGDELEAKIIEAYRRLGSLYKVEKELNRQGINIHRSQIWRILRRHEREKEIQAIIEHLRAWSLPEDLIRQQVEFLKRSSSETIRQFAKAMNATPVHVKRRWTEEELEEIRRIRSSCSNLQRCSVDLTNDRSIRSKILDGFESVEHFKGCKEYMEEEFRRK